jgi:hypothetical protein
MASRSFVLASLRALHLDPTVSLARARTQLVEATNVRLITKEPSGTD